MAPNKTYIIFLAIASAFIIISTFAIPTILLYHAITATTLFAGIVYTICFILSIIILGPIRLIRSGKIKRYINDIIKLVQTL